jgi:hypothetical protein
LARLCIAGMETNDALMQWERSCSQDGQEHPGGARLVDTLDVTEKTLGQIARSLEPLGIRNVFGSCVREEIGKWTADDFEQQNRITKVIDVTRYLAASGSYEVTFTYTGGWNGLSIERVALAAAPQGKPEDRKELSADKHHGSAAARNQANVYTVALERHEPAVQYFIVADVRGTPRHGRPPERQGCEGAISIKGVRPHDWRTRLELATPLSDEELQKKR